MKRILYLLCAIFLAFLLTACSKNKETVEDFYADMMEVRANSGDGRIYHTSVFNGQEIVNYKVWTKKEKVRVEKVDNESYSNYSTLYIDNGKIAYKYDPYKREAKPVFNMKEKKTLNPMLFLIYWGKNDAGYLNNLYKFGKSTKIENIPCRVVKNIDPATKKEGFSFCISPEYGTAVYFKIPEINLDGVKRSEKVTWVTKIEEEVLEDYLFELPQEANILE